MPAARTSPALAALAAAASFASVPAARAVPPAFEVRDGAVRITGVSAASPVIYDNDWWTDVPDAAYLWAKAGAGAADLRGNVVSRDMWEWRAGYKFSLDECVAEAEELRRLGPGERRRPRPRAGPRPRGGGGPGEAG